MTKRIFVTDRMTAFGTSARAPVDTAAPVVTAGDQLLPNNPQNILPNNPVIQPPAEPSEKLVGRAAFIQRQANAWKDSLLEKHRADMAAVMPEVADPGYERELDANGVWGDPNSAAQAFHRQSAEAWKGKK